MNLPRVIAAYILTHIPTGLFYIGSTKDVKERFYGHMSDLRAGDHNNPKLRESYTGKDDYRMDYEEYRTREEAYDREQELLDLFVGDRLCCNVNEDARLSLRPGSLSVDEGRMRTAAARAVNLTREYRSGFSHTEESKERMRQSALKRDPSTYRRGFTISEETREKMRIANARPRAKGRVFSDEHRANMSLAAKKKAEGTRKAILVDGIEYASSGAAAERLGISRRTVINRCIDDGWPNWSYVKSHGTEQAPITV